MEPVVKAQLIMSSDPRFTLGLMMNNNQQNIPTRVLYVGDPNPSMPKEFIPCSILLPPCQALEAEINGDMNMYNVIYLNYLRSLDPYQMFATILAALNKGVIIILHVENGDELSHKKVLIDFLMQAYGIQPCLNEQIPFAYNQWFDPCNISILYMLVDGLVTVDEVFSYMPNIQAFIELDAMHNGMLLAKAINDIGMKYDSTVNRDYYLSIIGERIFYASIKNNQGSISLVKED